MTPKLRKRLLRWTLIPITVLFVLLCLAVAVLYSQQQRLVRLGVDKINKQLPGELVVAGSELSLFQNFPYISIALTKVQLFAGKQRVGRPLYEAERMYAGFSLPDILRQKYRVKVIALKNGHLDLVQYPNGDLNIEEAIRMSGDTAAASKGPGTENLDLDIKKVVLKNFDVSLVEKEDSKRFASHIERIQASLRDDSLRLEADLTGAMALDYVHPGDTTSFRHMKLGTDIEVSYVKADKVLSLLKGRLQLNEAAFNMTGTADLAHDNMVDLRFSGDKPDIGQLLAFAPKKVSGELKHFKYSGELAFDGLVKGKLKGGSQPLIELHFSCAHAWLHNTRANKRLDSLAFKGYYTNGPSHNLQTSELRLLDMHAKPGEGVFRGNFVLRNFADPKVLMQINSDLELGFVGAFLGIKDLQRITGRIILNMDLKELVDLDLPAQSMNKLTQGVQSELTVRDLTFRIPAYPYTVEHLGLHANMKNGLVKMDSLSFQIGHSDFHAEASLSDLPAVFHHQQKPILLTLHAHSRAAILKELLSFDSTRSARAKEEIYGFNIGLTLETSVSELLHPRPLPKGKLHVDSLSAAFKRYPHAFHDFGADLAINDTALLLRNFAGRIDSSDLRFSGRVTHYALWFDSVMKGKTQVAFDLKSQHLAMADLLGRKSRNYVPRAFREEIASGLWLRSKMDLRYDSTLKFANIKIANISGTLQKHDYQLDSIHGNIKWGSDDFIKIDTLQGKIGRSDFLLSMRLYAGKDTIRRKKENFLSLSSRLLDVDQLTSYYLAAGQEEGSDSSATANATATAQVSHADDFNLFRIPFIDFNATVNIGRLRLHHLGMKHFSTGIRMQANQQLFLDTFSVEMAGGRITADGHFDGSNADRIYLHSRINAEDVNIEKLMLKMDRLGQDYAINKNIKGSLSGQVESTIQVHPDLTPLMNNCEARLDLEIINGVLVNFGPMQAMSAYFGDKNLNMIRFDTLRNSLTFKDGTISIPDMNINSSLGFMEFSGKQSLDEKMEYYLRIPLKLVTQAGFHKLFGKKKEEIDPDQVDAIEYRDKDKRVRFMNLRITGTPEDYKVGLGKAKG
ncbi:MAG: AsmA-like C-terminal region-containing protein [Bacteroidota bacterium]|nr:AsmA-like C-terminal region-containing protein [Bacteroidota bacterium]